MGAAQRFVLFKTDLASRWRHDTTSGDILYTSCFSFASEFDQILPRHGDGGLERWFRRHEGDGVRGGYATLRDGGLQRVPVQQAGRVGA